MQALYHAFCSKSKKKWRYEELHSEETVSQSGTCCRIIDIRSRGNREHGKQRARARGIDERFYSLDERSQRVILSHMIGYMEAAKDLISAGRHARVDEISSAFGVMEDMVNEAWKGGMI